MLIPGAVCRTSTQRIEFFSKIFFVVLGHQRPKYWCVYSVDSERKLILLQGRFGYGWLVLNRTGKRHLVEWVIM